MFVGHLRIASYQPTVSANAISGRFTQPTTQKNLTGGGGGGGGLTISGLVVV